MEKEKLMNRKLISRELNRIPRIMRISYKDEPKEMWGKILQDGCYRLKRLGITADIDDKVLRVEGEYLFLLVEREDGLRFI